MVPARDAPFYALFHAVAAFCNAGFDLFTGTPEYPEGVPADPITLLTLGWLVIIGGLGIPVYMESLHRRRGFPEASKRSSGRRRRLSLQTRLALWSALILILVGWAGLLVSEYRHAGVLSGLSFGERVLRAWFQSVAARTAGFAGFNDFANLHEASRLLLICLMFIGSAPASMGGGITTGTLLRAGGRDVEPGPRLRQGARRPARDLDGDGVAGRRGAPHQPGRGDGRDLAASAHPGSGPQPCALRGRVGVFHDRPVAWASPDNSTPLAGWSTSRSCSGGGWARSRSCSCC